MENLTLIVPAKNEKESLPIVLEELKKYNLKIIIILEKTDFATIEAIKDFNCKILYQAGKGYGDALILGLNEVETKYFCIFNADGSFNPIELKDMYDKLEYENQDLVFATRYEKNCSSEDDTFVTYIGNYLFSKIGNVFFKLKITDILYTFVMGKAHAVRNLNLKNKDFVFCVELPILAKKKDFKIATTKSNERPRIGGIKKVNAIRDEFYILLGMIKLFFK